MGMLAFNRLRVDPGDGSPVQDYRIENGHVEMRLVDFNMKYAHQGEGRWRRLSREQLSWHVVGDTAVARWLQRRMGLHSLIRVCAQTSCSEDESSSDSLVA